MSLDLADDDDNEDSVRLSETAGTYPGIIRVRPVLSGPDVQARICKAVFSVWDQAGESLCRGLVSTWLLGPAKGGSFLPSLGVCSLSDCSWRTGLWRNSRCALLLKPCSSQLLLCLQWAGTNLGCRARGRLQLRFYGLIVLLWANVFTSLDLLSSSQS